jgi:hypothetical protein
MQNPSRPLLSEWTPLLLQGKNARMQREAASNVRKLTKIAAQTITESKRKLPKVLMWGRTN